LCAWTGQEVATYRKAHPLKRHHSARRDGEDAVNRQPVVRCGRDDPRGHYWRRVPSRTEKTDKAVTIAIAPDLRAAPDAMPSINGPAILLTAYGKPYPDKGFGVRMAPVMEAGLSSISSHGPRKTISNRMALAGISSQGIKQR